jgi:hypothetical protein
MALEKNVVIVFAIVDLIGLFSVLLGFSAEATKTQVINIHIFILSVSNIA